MPRVARRAIPARRADREQVLALEQRDDLLLDAILLGSGGLDLVEQRGEFLVGLDGGLVLVEPRESCLGNRDALLEVAPGQLVLRECGLDAVDAGGGLGELRVELLFEAGQVREALACGLGRGVEFLERDE